MKRSDAHSDGATATAAVGICGQSQPHTERVGRVGEGRFAVPYE